MEVGAGDEAIIKGVDGSDSSEFAIVEIEAGAEDLSEVFRGGFEEEIGAIAEDAAGDLGG